MSGIAQLKRAITSIQAPRTGKRLDIQGLRAFAVVVVILDHLMHWPSGGFVGVDIFFVISGFVITQSLLRGHARTGKINVKRFFLNRVRRIMPASALTLLTTVAAAYIAFGQSRFITTVEDVLAASMFGANWRFNAVGTDYFQADGPVSPIQHFWSLAVEEQFYFVWPFLFVIVFALFSKSGRPDRGARFILGVVISVICLASFAWALLETVSAPTTAYFSTFTRAWELGIGGLLAILAPACARIAKVIRPILAWVGVTGMVASLFLISGTTPFPGTAALLPVLSAGLFIVAGSGTSSQPYALPFTNRVSTYIGDMSYSLYLWHFPIIIFSAVWIDTAGLLTQLGIIGAIFIWSYFAYVLWEKWILDSSWLSERKKPKAPKTSKTPLFSEAYKLQGTALLITLFLAVMYVGFQPAKAPEAAEIPLLPASAPTATAENDIAKAAFGPEVTKLQADLTTAVKSTAWPQLTPTLDEVIATDPIPPGVGPCGGVNPPPAAACTWGDPDAPRTAFIIGDSVAQTYIPALREIYGIGEWKLRGLSMYGCRSIDLEFTQADADQAAACSERKAQVIEEVNTTVPDLVIVVNSYFMAAKIKDTDTEATPDVWKAAMASYVGKMASSGSKFVVITPPPADKNPTLCATKQSTPRDCLGKITSTWQGIAKADTEVMESIGGTVVTTNSLFCVASYCPAYSGTLPIKRDATHMIPDYALKIVPALREVLAEAGV